MYICNTHILNYMHVFESKYNCSPLNELTYLYTYKLILKFMNSYIYENRHVCIYICMITCLHIYKYLCILI